MIKIIKINHMNQDFKILNHKLAYYGKILMIHFQQYFQN